MRTVKRRRHLLTLLAAALLAVTAAGCGGSDEPTVPEFEAEVVSAVDRVNFALARISQAESFDETFIRMEEAAAAIGEASSALDDAGAPEEFADEGEKLVTSLDQLAVDLEALSSDLQNPDLGITPETIPKGFDFESWTEANEAVAAMIGEGLEVPVIKAG